MKSLARESSSELFSGVGMGAFLVLLAGLGGLVGWCAYVLGRRNRTENFDGLLIEQEATQRARRARMDAR
ncbi:hypothetical protein EQG64_26050 [Streptomyces sp. S6]|nr:hypothetical protein EQG64_26050 [Streptomyces sp. S6]